MNRTLLRFFGFLMAVTTAFPLYSQIRIDNIPDDLSPSYNGKEVVFTKPLILAQTYYKYPSGTVLVSPDIPYTPTEIALPGPNAITTAAWLASCQIGLRSSQFSFIDSDNTLRTGTTIPKLQGILSYDGSKYYIEPTIRPEFVGNERTLEPLSVGNSTLRVANFNLEFYIANSSLWSDDQNNGATSQSQFNRQRAKILAALKGLKADIYALCEVGQGNVAMTDLVKGLNEVTGTSNYAYVADGDLNETVYTKNVFIYDKTKVTPYGEYYAFGSGNMRLRQVAQAFQQKSNGERFVVTVNHLKSKGSGYGLNADQKDGQGPSNYDRVAQARKIVQNLNLLATKYNDPDILVVGDMNAYTMEDPMRTLQSGGLINQLGRFAPREYSYVFRGNMGYLDHSWATSSLSAQITGARPWRINSDEPDYLGYANAGYYSPTPYRCSDHDPILTGIALGNPSSGIDEVENKANKLQVVGNIADGYVTLHADQIDRVELLSGSGMLVRTELNQTPGQYFVLQTSDLQKGFYLIRAFQGNQPSVAKLLVP